MRVEHLAGVRFVLVVVLTKHKRHKAPFLIQDRDLVQLVIPDEIVRFAQSDAFTSEDNVF